jgi:hypothetical protein
MAVIGALPKLGHLVYMDNLNRERRDVKRGRGLGGSVEQWYDEEIMKALIGTTRPPAAYL